MLGRENTGSALGSGAVDADFWALVCEDEEWLDAEFDAIVSEAGETPARSRRRLQHRYGSERPRDAGTPTIRDHPAVAGRPPARRAVAAATGSALGRVTTKAVFRRLKLDPS